MLQGRENSRARDYWKACGGTAALKSYAPPGEDTGKLVHIPEEHWHFIEKDTLPWYEISSHFFVHANAYPDCDLDYQPDHILFWESFDDPPPHINKKIAVCGHPTKSADPRNIGHAVCIDTSAYDDGWLTCLDVKSGKYWQANERGETRSDAWD